VNPDAKIHLGGGEPFLKPALVVRALEIAAEMGVQIDFVETNGSWAKNDDIVEERLEQLIKAGMKSLLVGVSPYHNEKIPFENTKRLVKIGTKVLGQGQCMINWINIILKKMILES
jgi:hypothetical protein